jgi:WD40 repeat protein
MIVSGSADNSIKIWDANTGELIKILDGHEESVNSIKFFNRDEIDKKLKEFLINY